MAKDEILFLKDFVSRIAVKEGVSQAEVKRVLEAFVGLTTKALKSGTKVRITGLGTFTRATRAARKARNPRTGEPVKVKATKTVRFKVSSSLKSAL